MSSSTASEASCSSTAASPAPGPFFYDVFLSFRGSDTRHGFVSHLYDALKRKGISTFKDDEKLERGKLISPEILRVIGQSRFSIVIFSVDYASSPWCLEELQIIMQCMEEEKTKAVLPVFYGIDLSDVSEVKNSYAESFAKHEKNFPEDTEMIRSWRDALSKAAELSGWDSRNRDEPSLIDEIVTDVLNKLGRETSNKPIGHLVGMEPRIKEVESLLSTGLVDVRMVGIWGMSGIGKTTIAEAVYHHISHKFDACCFLKSVREAAEKHGLDQLRNKLLSALIVEDGLRILDEQLDLLIEGRLRNKCVLIVLDDVSSLDQLMSLAGYREWFGPGSRIIITTKDRHLLEQHEVDSVYEVKLLSCDESLKLLRQRAFKKQSPIQDFRALSERVINYAQGLPLAIKVLGSSLFNMNGEEWESKLNILEEDPPGDIVKILRLSLDVLERSERNMFLDVACFFNGEDTDYVVSILEGCGFSARYGLKVLIHRSLLTIQDDKVWMHDLLQHVGREVVRQESFNDTGRRSRLWKHEDVCSVLTQNSGTNDVEGIALDISKLNNEMSLEVEAFHKMNRLRLLKIFYPNQPGASEYDFKKDLWVTGPRVSAKRMDTTIGGSNLHLFGKLRILSNELRSLHWRGYPFESLPSTFNPCNLVELNLSHSSLKKLWIGKKVFKKLKIMKLSYSHALTQTPDFSGIQNLEILILEGCVKLIEVHPSVGSLEKLVYLNLKGCKSLVCLPPSIAMKSLEILALSGCSKLKKFPEIEENMSRLSELYLDGTGIKALPASIGELTSLVVLSVTNCKHLESIPMAVGCCHALKILRLSGCTNLRQLQFELNWLENLEEIHADGTALSLSCLVADGYLMKLTVLNLHGSSIQNSTQKSWRILLSETIGSSFTRPSSPQHPDVFGLNEFSFLTSLDLSNCNLTDFRYDISCLVWLTKLDLSGNDFHGFPTGFKFPMSLELLFLANCKNLVQIPSLPAATHWVEAPNCPSLTFICSPELIKEGKRCLNLMDCSSLGYSIRENRVLKSWLGVPTVNGFYGEAYPYAVFSNFTAAQLLMIHVDQTPIHTVAELSIIVPGEQILDLSTWEWLPSDSTVQLAPYGSRNSTASATLEQPIWARNTTLRGLVMWADFEAHRRSTDQATHHFSALDTYHALSLHFRLENNGHYLDSGLAFALSSRKSEVVPSGSEVQDSEVRWKHTWLRFVPAVMLTEVIDWRIPVVKAVFVTHSPDLVVYRCGLLPIWRPVGYQRS